MCTASRRCPFTGNSKARRSTSQLLPRAARSLQSRKQPRSHEHANHDNRFVDTAADLREKERDYSGHASTRNSPLLMPGAKNFGSVSRPSSAGAVMARRNLAAFLFVLLLFLRVSYTWIVTSITPLCRYSFKVSFPGHVPNSCCFGF